MRFALIAVLAAAQLAAAGPALTTIQDTLYKADGTRFDGVAQIEWKSFRASDGSEIPQQSLLVKVSFGQLRVSLVPTTNTSRPKPYKVRFNSDGRTQFTEYWAVPPSVSAVRLKDVRTDLVADPITQGSGEITDITGLREELDIRPVRGTAYTTSRAAVINAAGALDGAIGNPGDCVRVNGTSGPCGDGSSLAFIDAETPTGPVDGNNRQFTLAAAPITAASLHLFRNGLLLKQGTEYSLEGPTITVGAIATPAPGDILEAWYRIAALSDTYSFSESETPTGDIDGGNAVFTFAFSPHPANSLQLYRNGILQKAGVDFILSGNKATFLPLSIPQSLDILQATYRH